MNRRSLLKNLASVFGGAILPSFLRPNNAHGWGAISGLAPTHQFIVDRAMRLLSSDPIVQHFNFPTTEEIQSRDNVQVGLSGLTGPGPDASGNSDYSWHYFNPKTGKGNAPAKAAEYFGQMMIQRVWNGDQTWGAAWSAHFLADMFVPFHTVGMPAVEVERLNDSRRYILNWEICDDWRIMYSPSKLPPPQWGLNHDHTANIQRFCASFWPGHPDRVDWFDPWYWNGYGAGTTGVVSGSHAVWEGMASKGLEFFDYEQLSQRIQMESWYDPIWLNRKSAFGEQFWSNQSGAVRAFTGACARRTRDNARGILKYPFLGMAMAARAVLTLYRASMTALGLSYSQELLPQGGYRIFGNVFNGSLYDHVDDVEVSLRFEGQRGSEASVHRLNGSIPPNQSASVYWDVPSGAPVDGLMEVSGLFRNTPDMGYARMNCTAQGTELQQTDPEGREQERVDVEMLKTWEGRWTMNGRVLDGPEAGKEEQLPSLIVTVNGATATLRQGSGSVDSPVSVSDGGRCIEFNESNPNGPEYWKGRFCLEPDGNSYRGRLEGHNGSFSRRTEVWGRRM